MLIICRESMGTENDYSLDFITHTNEYHPTVSSSGLRNAR